MLDNLANTTKRLYFHLCTTKPISRPILMSLYIMPLYLFLFTYIDCFEFEIDWEKQRMLYLLKFTLRSLIKTVHGTETFLEAIVENIVGFFSYCLRIEGIESWSFSYDKLNVLRAGTQGYRKENTERRK